MREMPAGELAPESTPDSAPGKVALSARDRWCWVERARAAAQRAAESRPPESPEAVRDVPAADAPDTGTPVTR